MLWLIGIGIFMAGAAVGTIFFCIFIAAARAERERKAMQDYAELMKKLGYF